MDGASRAPGMDVAAGSGYHGSMSKQPGDSTRRSRKPSGSARSTGERRKPHPRTVHAADPRQAAYDTLRRMSPGDLAEPAAFATVRHLGADPGLAARILPMLEDALRFGLLFDHLISHVASRSVNELDDNVRAALHLFLAWLIHDPRAAYAHGNAAVDLLAAGSSARGFVNACARKLSSFIQIVAGEAEDYRGAAVRHESLPLWPDRCRIGGGRMLTAERAIFPDPASALPEHLSIVGGLPLAFTQRLISQHGPAAATQVAIACVEKPAIWIRPNVLYAGVFHVPHWWTAQGITVERIELEGGAALALPAGARAVTNHPDFAAGGFYAQDFVAQQVAPVLGAKPGEALLDLCAAPGGKAGHLAELTGDKARILACDVSQAKVERIQENLRRMGYRSIATVVADATNVQFPEKFDRVLIDAPCSNSGVLARRVEARHRIKPETLRELAALQLSILENAAANLKPGGTIVYSVCSVLMEECVDVVHKFMNSHRLESGWEVMEEKFLLPVPAWHDGGYICRIEAP